MHGQGELATKTDLAAVRAEVAVIRWVVGIQSAVVPAIALRVFGVV